MDDECRSMPKPGDHLTGAAISAIWSSMTVDGAIFRYTSWEDLARAFVKPFFEGDARISPISELRACYLAIPGAITCIRQHRRPQRRSQGQDEEADLPVPEEAEEFGRFIGDCLSLRELPHYTLLNLYEKASSDLRAIEANIRECEDRIVKHGGDPKNKKTEPRDAAGAFGENKSWIQVYHYYAAMNREARDEIFAFLTHDVRDEALRASCKPWNFADWRVPYSYAMAPDFYEPDHFSDVANKFAAEPISEYYEWQHCYANDQSEFFTRLRVHLADKRPWEIIRCEIEHHHRLNARKNILLAALDAYERSQWTLFSTLAVVQIEGLFLDYCEDLGIGASELQAATLPEKLTSIRKVKSYYHDFPYYAYRLPVIRNHLAHGRMLGEGEEEQTAHLLLLDLLDVCHHVTDRKLLVNILVTRIRDAATPLCGQDTLAVAFLEKKRGRHPLPAFYKLDDRLRTLREHVDSDDVATLVMKLKGPVEDRDTRDQWFLDQLKELVVDIKKRSGNNDRWKPVLAGWETRRTPLDVPSLDHHKEWSAFDEILQRYA